MKVCPLNGSKSLSQDCIECDSKGRCKSGKLDSHSVACIGVDQSYKRTGISLSIDGVLMQVSSVDTSKLGSKFERRLAVYDAVKDMCAYASPLADEVILVMERIRQFSQGFINVCYIEHMGALSSTISDCAKSNGVKHVYTIDTRAWKTAVVGTSKGSPNQFGMDEKKFPTADWLRRSYPHLFKKALHEVAGRRQKGTYISKSGKKLEVDDDLCDSAAISMSWFMASADKFKEYD